MTTENQDTSIIAEIQRNCDISDARDHGIYSMCTMVLKLRNLYKWENSIEPWEEPEPADLLDWIEVKENYWATIAEEPYRPVISNGRKISPCDSAAINAILDTDKLIYGAGYGRSLKSVFYLAEVLERHTVEGCPVLISGKEIAKEMASPFAMAQEGVIYIRREPLRYFLWDQIQELRSSCRISLRHALDSYGLLEDGQLSQERFKTQLDNIVEKEMDLFVYHEVGEILQTTFDSQTLQKIIVHFPGTVIELVSRALKDILADTHPRGVLNHITREERESTLSFYVGFLDGLRKKLFPEIAHAYQQFQEQRDWQVIEQARRKCQENNLKLAGKIKAIVSDIDRQSAEQLQSQFNTRILLPMGLDIPK